MSEKESAGLKSVLVALDVLEHVSQAPGEVGVSELSSQMGVAKGAIYRHLQTLVSRGYLWQNPATSRYKAGIQCHLLGKLASVSVDLIAAAGQPMQQLRDTLGFTVTLAVRKGSKVVTVERLFGTTAVQIGVRPGAEFQLHGSAQGKLFLAYEDRSLWNDLKGRTLERTTVHTIVDVAELERQVDTVRKTGWASAPDEALLGINGIAVPVFDNQGACVAALAIVGSTEQLKQRPSKVELAALKHSAAAISTQLGYRG
jgi:IclR family KDG regulon transcriptional repressor